MTPSDVPPATSTTDKAEDIDGLILQIECLQSRGKNSYSPGIFPSRRTHPYFPYSVEDETIFFTAMILYTLQQLMPGLSGVARASVESMTARYREQVPRFRNRQGHPIYNYWQVQPVDRFFPNGVVLSRFRTFRLPEDIDTTAYIYLTGYHDRTDAARFQQRLTVHANGSQRWIRHSLPHHRHLRAYSTWMGESNMPVDFDVCAVSNTLLALSAFGLPPTQTDMQSVAFIDAVVRRGEHLSHPYRSAPWYGSPAVILYHLARLIRRSDVPDLRTHTGILHRDVQRVFASSRLRPMEKVLLSTASMWLGGKTLVARIDEMIRSDVYRYPFFVASLLAVPENRVARVLAPRPLFHLRYICPAHSLTLVAEHEVIRMSR